MVRCIVSAASNPTVASRAGADRLLRTEPQVYLFLSRRFHIINNRMSDFMSRTPKRTPFSDSVRYWGNRCIFDRYSLTLRTRLPLSSRLLEILKIRYRLFRRGIRGNAIYCVDTKTGKRTSLGTDNEDEARQIVEAKNQSESQPF
jgi:hypothetical protein